MNNLNESVNSTAESINNINYTDANTVNATNNITNNITNTDVGFKVVDTVKVECLNAYYGNSHILHNIDFTAKSGQILGIIGPSGCGKTTLINCIVGLHKKFTGTVNILDKSMPNLKVLNDLGFMAQKTALYETISARANFKFFGKLYGLKGKVLEQRITEIANLMNLVSYLNQKISSFSGGMKQRVSLGIALLSKPKILILDEPTVGIDPLLRVQIWNEIRDLAHNQGITVLVSTHIMDEAENCDQVVIMRTGKILIQGTPKVIESQMQVESLEQAFIKVVSNEPIGFSLNLANSSVVTTDSNSVTTTKQTTTENK